MMTVNPFKGDAIPPVRNSRNVTAEHTERPWERSIPNRLPPKGKTT
jgi:hypothetical protein